MAIGSDILKEAEKKTGIVWRASSSGIW
jgi:hypothetical protein